MSEHKRNVSPLRIGIKYCGGCNPGYDRAALATKIQRALSEEVLLVDPEDDPHWIIAMQGCPTACADIGPFPESNIIHIKDEADLHRILQNGLYSFLPEGHSAFLSAKPCER